MNSILYFSSVPLKNFNAKQMDLFFALCARMKDRGLKKVRGLTRNGAIIPDYLKKCYKDLPKRSNDIKQLFPKEYAIGKKNSEENLG